MYLQRQNIQYEWFSIQQIKYNQYIYSAECCFTPLVFVRSIRQVLKGLRKCLFSFCHVIKFPSKPKENSQYFPFIEGVMSLIVFFKSTRYANSTTFLSVHFNLCVWRHCRIFKIHFYMLTGKSNGNYRRELECSIKNIIPIQYTHNTNYTHII